MLQDSLGVNLRELLRVGNCLQDLRQVLCCSNAIHGSRLERAGSGMMKAKGLK
jgi:hypothetical protein